MACGVYLFDLGTEAEGIDCVKCSMEDLSSPVSRICQHVTFLQTAVTSKVDICTKCSISQLYYIVVSHLSWQEVEGKVVVLLQSQQGFWTGDCSWSHTTGYFSRHCQPFLWWQSWVFYMGSQAIAICDRGDQNSYFKPNHVFFLTLTKWYLSISISITRAKAQRVTVKTVGPKMQKTLVQAGRKQKASNKTRKHAGGKIKN